MLHLDNVAGGIHIDPAPAVRRLAGAPEEGGARTFLYEGRSQLGRYVKQY